MSNFFIFDNYLHKISKPCFCLSLNDFYNNTQLLNNNYLSMDISSIDNRRTNPPERTEVKNNSFLREELQGLRKKVLEINKELDHLRILKNQSDKIMLDQVE